MPAGNSHLIVAAAHRSATATRRRAVPALRRMNATGTTITFETVASGRLPVLALQPAGPQSRVRAASRSPPADPRRTAGSRLQRASDASLLRRLEAATERNRQLEAENRELRQALALALGERRTADVCGIRATAKPPAPRAIGPC